MRTIGLFVLLVGCGGGGGGGGPVDAGTDATPTSCGDGRVDEGEECDDGAANAETGACLPDCVAASCGDGFVGPDEACDDANDDDTDPCLSTCALASCGDGFLRAGVEVCDDGGRVDGDGCSAQCDSTLVWSLVEDGGQDDMDRVMDVATGADGAVFAAGTSRVDLPGFDIWARKLDRDGATTWTRTYDGVLGGSDFGTGIAVGASGVAVVGYEDTSVDRDYDGWLRFYDGDGYEMWTRTYDGATSDDDLGQAVAIGADGSVVFVGTELSYYGDVGFVRQYDPVGDESWTQTRFDVRPGAVAIDGDGNVFAGGSGGSDAWILKLDANGQEIFSRAYPGERAGSDEVQDLAIAPDGGIAVAGTLQPDADIGAFRRTWVARLDAAGEVIWSDLPDGVDAPLDAQYDRGVAVDVDGNVIAVATAPGDGTDVVWIRKYDAQGDVVWTQTWDEPGTDGDYGLAAAVDAEGFIAAGGYVRTTPEVREGPNFWIARFAP